MIYGDETLKIWWKNLAETSKQEIFQKMVEKAPSETFCEFARSLRDQHDRGMQPLSPKQLQSIKKWDRD